MSGPRYSQAGLQALKYGDRIVPARQQLNLLAAVDNLPPRHDCPGLKTCVFHGRWTVIKSVFGRWWALAPTGPGRRDRKFPTHAQAVAYATAQARAEQLAAIQDQETGL